MPRVMTWEESFLPNKWMPLSAAVMVHAALLVWNPLLMKGGLVHDDIPKMIVEYRDSLPPPAPPVVKKVEPPKPKPVAKKPPKKAHKSGLAMQKKPMPVPVKQPIPKPAPKPFVSRISIPKFVPRSAMDEPIAAAPMPTMAQAAPRKAIAPIDTAPQLKTKTRGIRAMDVNFKLEDRGSITGASKIVAIPVAEERGDTPVLPNAPMIHDAPKGRKAMAGYRYAPGQGTADLEGKNKSFAGYHAAIKMDKYVEGSIAGSSGKGRTQIGQGFEIGGPVGDRKILHRRLPEYPSWAEEKGITAMVVVFFTVRSDGTIRTTMRIEKSSGYPELDALAKKALSEWRFSATNAASSEDDAWGRITFKFTLA